MNQHHVIKKQIMDITLNSQVGSFGLQGQISSICHDIIAPIVDRYLSSAGDPDHIHRIEKLEIDLGEIRKEYLEKDFSRKMEELFPRVLFKKINNLREYTYDEFNDHGKDGRLTSLHRESSVDHKCNGYELLEFFIAKGRLPWWGKKGSISNMSGLLKFQIKQNPKAVKRLFSESLKDEVKIKRIVYQFDDSDLNEIVKLVQAHHKSISVIHNDILECLTDYHLLRGVSPGKIRTEIWLILLQMSGGSDNHFTQKVVIGVAFNLAKKLNLDQEKIATSLIKRLKKRGYVLLDVTKIHKKSNILSETGVKTQREEKRKLLSEVKNNSEKSELIEVSLRKLSIELSAVYRLQYIISQQDVIKRISSSHKLLKELLKKGTVSSRLNIVSAVEIIEKIIDNLEQVLRDLEKTSDREFIFRAIRSVDNVRDLIIETSLNKSNHYKEKLQKTSYVNPFSDSDEVFVNNSGIVLFWPYLTKLFQSTGVMKKSGFLDDEKRMRALFMLQYLANGSENSPEYDLVLNKIICGMEADEPVDSFITLSEKEKGECDDLLKAVISNWISGTSLKEFSQQGFRSMFLIRDGLIHVRDATLVLKVEEKAHDILLDKLPWSVSTIKLPWMESPLFTEWRL